MRVVGRAADQPFVEREVAVELGVHDRDELLHLAHRLGADAVAGKQQKGARCHAKKTFRECDENRRLANGREPGVQVPLRDSPRSPSG